MWGAVALHLSTGHKLLVARADELSKNPVQVNNNICTKWLGERASTSQHGQLMSGNFNLI